MPINATPAYFNAEAEYHQAEGSAAKLRCLKKMLATAPNHKGSQKLRGEIKKKIRMIKYKQEVEKKAGRGKSYSINKDGAAQLVFIGAPNSGKSTLLAKLSGKPVKIAEYEFTTTKPEMRMIPYENIWLQGIEIPAIYKGFHDTKLGREMYGLVKNSDFIVVVIQTKKELEMIKQELEETNIELSKNRGRDGLTNLIPHIVVTRKAFEDAKLTEKLWLAQGKIRVQTKADGKVAEKPIILNKGATVEDVARKIHKDFVKNFRFAKIWGKSAKFDGQQVGLEHKMKDKDVIEVFTR